MSTSKVIFSEEAKEGTESLLAEWFVKPGDRVTLHQPLCEVNTDKALVEVAAPCSGVIESILVETNGSVEPGTVLCLIKSESEEAATEAIEPSELSENPALEPSVPKPSVRATAAPSIADPKRGVAKSETEHRSIQRFADHHGIDLQSLRSEGRRVALQEVKARIGDVQCDTAFSGAPTSVNRLPSADSAPVLGKIVKHSAAQLQVARVMSESLLRVAPHVTAVFEIDMRSVIADRELRNTERLTKQLPKITLTAYFIAAACKAIAEVPEANSRWRNEGLEVFDEVHIGLGTKTDGHGLILPILRNVEKLSLEEIADEVATLAERARTQRLSTEDMQGATISISNHGMMGSLIATPIIIPQPQSAIIGVGALEDRARVIDDKIAVVPSLYLTLTIDHRVLNASHTNAFLSCMKKELENY